MRLLFTLSIGFNFIFLSAIAQLNLPEDEQMASNANSNYALLADNMKSNNYDAARKPLQWIVKNTPELHLSVYIHGVNLYKALEKRDSAKEQLIYQDSVILLYDLRMKYYNDRKNVMDRKSTAAYNFYKDREDKYKYLLDLFDETYKLNDSTMGLSNLATYMDVVKKYDAINPLSTEEILERYYLIMGSIEKHTSDDAEAIGGVVTNLLIKAIGDDFDCGFIGRELATKLKNNVTIAKRIIILSLAQGCTKEKYFTKAAKVLVKENPDPGLLRLVAGKEVEAGNYEAALGYYKKALDVNENAEKKSKLLLDIAKLYQVQDNYPKSREYAFEALSVDPNLSKAYKLIGDLYFNSFERCRENENKVKDRAVFWVAYDMYEKAGEKEQMQNALEQFPSIDDIFGRDYKEGSTFVVNCWINKQTVIRRRPK